MAVANRLADNVSVRSSVTEEGLEEARQRLLDHIEVENDEEESKCSEREKIDVAI